jgi:hypothetical protein
MATVRCSPAAAAAAAAEEAPSTADQAFAKTNLPPRPDDWTSGIEFDDAARLALKLLPSLAAEVEREQLGACQGGTPIPMSRLQQQQQMPLAAAAADDERMLGDEMEVDEPQPGEIPSLAGMKRRRQAQETQLQQQQQHSLDPHLHGFAQAWEVVQAQKHSSRGSYGGAGCASGAGERSLVNLQCSAVALHVMPTCFVSFQYQWQ